MRRRRVDKVDATTKPRLKERETDGGEAEKEAGNGETGGKQADNDSEQKLKRGGV